MKINENRKSLKTEALIFIGYQYQSIVSSGKTEKIGSNYWKAWKIGA